MEVLFEVRELFVEREKTETDIAGKRVVLRHRAQLGQFFSGALVLHHHHPNRIRSNRVELS